VPDLRSNPCNAVEAVPDSPPVDSANGARFPFVH
jgi:hypothetical protein